MLVCGDGPPPSVCVGPPAGSGTVFAIHSAGVDGGIPAEPARPVCSGHSRQKSGQGLGVRRQKLCHERYSY